MKSLWKKTLRGGLESIEGKVHTLDDYFDCCHLKINKPFIWEKINIALVQTVHVMSGMEIMPSYGLILEQIGNKKVFLTTDTQFCPHQIEKFYDMADVILHDCETGPFHSRVHAHYDFLKTLPEETKRKMWLYHYNPEPKQNPKKDGFKGFLKKGQVLDFTIKKRKKWTSLRKQKDSQKRLTKA